MDVDEAVRLARGARLSGTYTVVNKNEPHAEGRGVGVAYLSQRDAEFEETTGQDSAVRRNLEKQGYEVRLYWEQGL